MPNQHDNTKLVRIKRDTYDRVRAEAEVHSRTLSAQIDVIINQVLPATPKTGEQAEDATERVPA